MAMNLYEQLMHIAAYAAEHGHTTGFNPRPPGCVVPGSGTDQVRRLLQQAYPYSLPTAEIRRRTGLGRGCIAWALRYLEQTGKLEVFRYDSRRGTGYYLRYRAVKHDD